MGAHLQRRHHPRQRGRADRADGVRDPVAQGQRATHISEMTVAMTTFGDIAANISGVRLVRHAVLTFAGAFAAPGTGYPSDVVNAAAADLVYEVPVQSPWTFGPI